MKNSINLFIVDEISNPAKIIGGSNGLTTGADEHISTSTASSEID